MEWAPLAGIWKKEGDVVDVEKQELLDAMKTQTMTSEDWDKLLGGAKKITFPKGKNIITAGESFQSLYQIEKGSGSVSMVAYFNVLRVLGLQDDFLKLAANDEYGRKLQDLSLIGNK